MLLFKQKKGEKSYHKSMYLCLMVAMKVVADLLNGASFATNWILASHRSRLESRESMDGSTDMQI